MDMSTMLWTVSAVVLGLNLLVIVLAWRAGKRRIAHEPADEVRTRDRRRWRSHSA